MVIATAASGVMVTLPRDHLRMVLTLSCVGYSLAVVYAFLGSPDVALVAVLIETIFALVLIAMLVLMPKSILRYEARLRPARWKLGRDAIVATIAGLMAFFVAWSALSRPSASTSVISRQIELTPLAHGYDIVTVILADFRGFDTLGEITVVAIAFLGIISLIRVGRLR
jgi:multicomponent Na+:H+ antiporter subunit A